MAIAAVEPQRVRARVGKGERDMEREHAARGAGCVRGGWFSGGHSSPTMRSIATYHVIRYNPP